MSAMAFDTLKTSKDLAAAGFEPAQAEALAHVIATSLSSGVATKEDVAKLDGKIDSAVSRLDGKIDSAVSRLDGKIESAAARLDGKIDAVATRLEGKIDRNYAEQKSDNQLLKWMVGTVIALVAGLLVRLLFVTP
jgi:hypothetical protein